MANIVGLIVARVKKLCAGTLHDVGVVWKSMDQRGCSIACGSVERESRVGLFL